jgi:predicted Zn-dependent protease
MASVDSERLKSENVRTYNLTEQAILICENRKNDTLIKSERLRLDAKIKSHKLLDHANFINESIKRKADIDAATIREKANSHASELIENAHDEAEKIRHLSYIQRLKSKKQQLLMITSVLAVVLVVVMFYSITQVVPPQVSNFRTGYVIQNLKGDTVDTWVLWHHPSEKQFDIHVKNSQFVTKERLDAIRDVVLSQETLKIDDSLLQKGPQGTTSIYYAGWLGALDSIDTNTKFPIVRNLNFGVDDEIPTGDIMIELTDLSSPDGYSGYTASIVDDSNHQILKSTITIYNINKISTENLKTIVRHELGHGFGLGHSTANEDLMAPVITTSYPYISQCDLDAIRYLYDGGQKSQVICAK